MVQRLTCTSIVIILIIIIIICTLPLNGLPSHTDDHSLTKQQSKTKLSRFIRILEELIQLDRRPVKRNLNYVKTVGGNAKRKNCAFPFTYDGNTFYACTCMFSTVPWCATTHDFDRDKEWGYCVPDTQNQVVEFEGNSDGQCHLPFDYRGDRYRFCPCYSKNPWPWCATAPSFETDEKYRYCAVTACPLEYCQNGGKCKITAENITGEIEPYFTCKCPVGYTGLKCEKMIECPAGFCQHGGKCSVKTTEDTYKFICQCVGDYEGDQCEQVSKCGEPTIPTIDQRIIGGKEALPHSWPWQAALKYSPYGDFKTPRRSYHKCGGSVIAPYWILTSAHCIDAYNKIMDFGSKDYDVTHYKILLGDHSGSEVEAAEETFDVEKIFVNPNWDISILSHDIALLKLKKKKVPTATLR